MRKIISIISIIALIATLTSCNNNNIHKNDSTIKSTIKESETEEKKLYIEYNGYMECIQWTRIEDATSYQIFFDNDNPITIQDNYFSTSNMKFGYHKVTINAIKNSKTILSGTSEFVIEGITEAQAKDALKKLSPSIVSISTQKYNTTLGIIQSNKETETVEGIICYNNGNTYWAICYSPLLRTNINYDKTKINITDDYGNEYTGTEINPTNIKNRILTVISFSSKINLPTVNFGMKLNGNSKYILKYQISPKKTQIGKINLPTNFATINGTRTQNHLIGTTFDTTTYGQVVFNCKFEFIGIIVPNYEEKPISFMQLKEVLGYIDIDLQKKCIESHSVYQT